METVSAPGVVVIQGWDSNDQIKGVAAKLAAGGYRALVLNSSETGTPDIREAVQQMQQSSLKVALMGFWYSVPLLEYVDSQQIAIPFQAHVVTNDAAFPRSQVEALQAKLERTGVRYELHWYKATYPFADLAWQRTMDFLGKYLK